MRSADGLEAVAKPLHGRARYEHASFDRVLRRTVRQRGGERGDQPAARRNDAVAGVSQQKRAGTIGTLGLARRQAALADERRLLVAGDAA